MLRMRRRWPVPARLRSPCTVAAACAVSVLWCAEAPVGAQAPCAPDRALDAAAAQLLEEGGGLTGARLRTGARAAGSDAFRIHALRARASDGARVDAWLEEKRAASAMPMRCGRAQRATDQLVLVAESGGRLLADPRSDLRFRVALAAGFERPVVVVRGAGAPIHLPLAEGTDEVVLPDSLEPPFVVQLVAEDAQGPRPLAERVVGDVLGAEASAAVSLDESRGAEAAVAEWLASLRLRRRVPSLRSSSPMAKVAAAHAARMCDAGQARHSLGAGDPEARLRAGGVVARAVGEAVARSHSLLGAVGSLAASPSHEAALVDARFTDLGIGVARTADGATCLAVLLAAWPRVVGAPASKP